MLKSILNREVTFDLIKDYEAISETFFEVSNIVEYRANNFAPASQPIISIADYTALTEPLMESGESTVIGTQGDDLLVGTVNDDLLNGLGGDDILRGFAGDDILFGGDDHDMLYGGNGHDSLFGGEGDDLLDGGFGQDIAGYSTAVASVRVNLSIGAQDTGGAGFDTLISIENLYGSQFGDLLTGNVENNIIGGLAGNDIIDGGSGDDVLEGGDGDDILTGGLGDDLLDGGDGVDTVSYSASNNGIVVTLANTGMQDTQGAGFERLTHIENVIGSSQDDTISGDSTANILSGRDGHDLLNGGGGNDILQGENGNDRLAGGAGDDTIDGGLNIDTVEYFHNRENYTASENGGIITLVDNVGNDGTDTITSVENFTFTDGTFSLAELLDSNVITGTSGNDILTGTTSDNVIYGLAGNDVITGGEGNDTIDGGADSDTAFYSGNRADYQASETSGVITIIDNNGNDGTDTITNVELFTFNDGMFTMAELLNSNMITGTSGHDFLTGTSSGETINGLAGIDTIDGAGGDDILNGGDDNDRLEGGEGNDILDGGSGTDWARYLHSSAAVSVDLSIAEEQNTQGAGRDTLISIENLYGSAFDDHLFGDNFANSLRGNAGNDTLDGGAGDDRFLADDGNDIIIAGNGDDLITGGNGDDVIDGGADTDTAQYYGNRANFVVSEADGVITITDTVAGNNDDGTDTVTNVEFFSFSDGTVSLAELLAGNTITGTSDGDILTGTANDDTIYGLGGFDRIDGAEGNDNLYGGDDIDYLTGGEGDDLIDGGAGVDSARYDTSNAAVTVDLSIAVAQDTLGAGLDTLVDIEELVGSTFDDHLTGNSSDNKLFGNSGNDTLLGGAGNDFLHGHQGNDILNGGDGDDFLDGTHGNDIIDGGAGIDTAQYNGNRENFTVSELDGVITITEDIIVFDDEGTDTVTNVEFFSFSDGTFSVAELLDDGSTTFTEGNDNEVGTEGNDILNALGGNDIVDGLGGDDIINGGDGADRLIGGAGADALNGGDGFDSVDYRGASSAIRFNVDTGGTLGDANGDTFSGIERYYLSGFNDVVTGSDANEFFYGEDGNDTINAGGGLDRLYGGDGNDIQRGDGGNDQLYGSSGADQLNGGTGFDIANYSNAASAVALNLSSGGTLGDAAGDSYFGIEAVYGSDYNDILAGNNSANELRGGDGNDTLSGAGGNDRLFGGEGADALNGGTGTDIAIYTDATSGVTVNLATAGTVGDAAGDTYASVEWVWGSDFNDIITGDAGNNRLEGRDGNDTLNGDGGNDRLLGGDGNDTINGGDGVDTIFGQDGNDSLSGGAGNDFFFGSSGGDSMNGGLDFDTVSYLASSSAVEVDLQNGGTGGDAAGDSYVSIERLFGSQYDDALRGSNGDNTILGNGGNDYLEGGLGNDTLIGGAGSDDYGYNTTNGDADVINGFNTAGETIYILGGDAAFDTWAEVLAVGTDAGANAIFDFGGGNTLTIVGQNLSDLNAGDFDFGNVAPAQEMKDFDDFAQEVSQELPALLDAMAMMPDFDAMPNSQTQNLAFYDAIDALV